MADAWCCVTRTAIPSSSSGGQTATTGKDIADAKIGNKGVDCAEAALEMVDLMLNAHGPEPFEFAAHPRITVRLRSRVAKLDGHIGSFTSTVTTAPRDKWTSIR